MKSPKFFIIIGAGIAALVLAYAVLPLVAGDTMKHENALTGSAIRKYIVDAVNSPERPADDKKLDTSRRPDQLMAFFGVKPGMQVADIWAAAGYTTEILARIVGPTGKVYSQNTEFPEKFKAAEKSWKDRLAEPGMAGVVVEVTKPFDASDLLPVEPNSLDLIICNLNYHDMVGRGYNRDKLNATIFNDLKSGGVYAIVDNSAQAGSGARDTNTLHRIDEKFETNEIEKAGFKLAASSDILRNAKDPRTQPFWKMNRMQDRFVLKFVKP